MRARCPIALVALVVLVALLALSPPARAENWGLAVKLLRQANKACAGDQPESALPLYAQALEAKPLPQIHLAYGECLQKVGKCDQAVEHFKAYLKVVRSRRSREQGRLLVTACEEQLEQARAVRATSVPAEQAAPVEQPPDLRPASTAPAPRPSPPPPRRRLRPAAFWTGVGLTAALVAVGTATGVLALQKSDRFNDLGTPTAELQGLKDSGEALKLTSTISFAVGGAVAVATTVVFFFTRFKATETVSAAPLPGGAAVVVGGRF